MSGVFADTDALSNTTTLSGANSEVGPFVPELWSDETLATYKSNLVVAQLVVNMNHVGKKGDTVHIPTISSRRDAQLRRPATSGNEGVENLDVQPGQIQPTLTDVLINRHFEYSTLIEDFAAMQAMGGLRKFYTDDAGYSLSRRVDWDLHILASSTSPADTVNPGATLAGIDWEQAVSSGGAIAANRNATVIGSDGSTAWDESANTNEGNGASLADAGIRRMIRTLDDLDVPLTGRVFVVPPVEKESLLGIPRFTEQAFVGDVGNQNSIRNGLIGDLYSNKVYVSSNCPLVEAQDNSTDYRACLYLHKDAFVLVMQQNMRSQANYMLQYLSTLLVNDIAYGVSVLRGQNFVSFFVPA